jgi:hypothetical protein
LTKELRRIGAALAAFGKTYRKGTGTGRLSKSARARIAAAQRARWAKVRKAAKVVPIRGKRTLSAAARRKIAAAQRARWAKVKPGKKTALALDSAAVYGPAQADVSLKSENLLSEKIILPTGSCGRGWHFESVFPVVIEHDESGDVGIWEGISELLSCPDTGWMPGDIEVQDTPAIMGNDEEAIQKAKGDGRHCEEIHRGNRFAVVMQKGSPALRRFAVSGCTSHPT